MKRLDRLRRGLAKERCLIRAAKDPLFYLERRACLAAMGDALAGVEGAHVTLAPAVLRL